MKRVACWCLVFLMLGVLPGSGQPEQPHFPTLDCPGRGPDFGCLEFTPDGRYLLAARHSCPINVYDLTNRKLVRSLRNFGPLQDMVFSPRQDAVAVRTLGQVRVFELPTLKFRYRVLAQPQELTTDLTCTFSPDGRWLACSDSRGGVKVVWHPRGSVVFSVSAPAGSEASPSTARAGRAAWSPDSRWLLLPGGRLVSARAWAPTKPVIGSGFSLSNRHLARILETARRRQVTLEPLQGEKATRTTDVDAAVATTAFSPDGAYLLAWTDEAGILDRHTYVFDAATGRLLTHLTGEVGGLTRDGFLLLEPNLVPHDEGPDHLCRFDFGAARPRLRVPVAPGDTVLALADGHVFSLQPGTRYLDRPPLTRVVDMDTGREVRRLERELEHYSYCPQRGLLALSTPLAKVELIDLLGKP